MLRDDPNFRGFLAFLRTEMDRVDPVPADLCHDFFYRAVGLELLRGPRPTWLSQAR
jgi:thiaminase (transcriptional activator TenA)